jgi:hypothetical protein
MAQIIQHTFDASVVWLDECFLDLAVFYDECVTFTSVSTKDRSAIKGQIQLLGESERWIGDEANL